MHPPLTTGTDKKTTGPWLRLAWLGVLLLPVGLLLGGSLRAGGTTQQLLWLGTVFQVLGCLVVLMNRQNLRVISATPTITMYVIALSWMLLAAQGPSDWYFHMSQAILMVVPLGFFGLQCLRDSGALAHRRARTLADRLSKRRDWPLDLLACRTLPEVKAMRESLQIDASPALNLLTHPRLEARVAALAALEYRQNWQVGQPEMLLHLAQRTPDPEIKIGCVQALANVEDRNLIEPLAELMFDPVPEVRKAAIEALLWNTDQRWPLLRNQVRQALAHPNGQEDGPLFQVGPVLPVEAVADLTSWSTEKGTLGTRAALTLGVHYQQVLAHGSEPVICEELRRQVVDVHAPAMLRLELARILHQHHELDNNVLHHLIDPSTPAPLRLIAVEALLAQGDSIEATAALRELARLPNREIALATADVVQRRLGVPLGLPRGQPLPLVQSRLAADVARRLLLWASQGESMAAEPLGARPEVL